MKTVKLRERLSKKAKEKQRENNRTDWSTEGVDGLRLAEKRLFLLGEHFMKSPLLYSSLSALMKCSAAF